MREKSEQEVSQTIREQSLSLLSLVLHRPDPTYFNYSVSGFPTVSQTFSI